MSYAARVSRRRRATLARRARRLALVALAALALLTAEVGLITQLTSRHATAATAGEGELIPSLALPAPVIDQVEAGEPPCESDAVAEAIAQRDAAAVLEAMGGAERMRSAVAAGAAPCVPLDDPSLPWVVINKQRPLVPHDFAPAEVREPAAAVVRDGLRVDAVPAFDRLAAAAEEEGAGRLALYSGYRSYDTQIATYRSQVDARGAGGADAISARPGHSEHQLGLAADVVACDAGGCGSLDDLGATAQGGWLADNAWRFGWIVRYEDGHTATTGYDPEPWHLRFIGEELAAAYHEGGFHTLEDFFGLPPAADYD